MAVTITVVAWACYLLLIASRYIAAFDELTLRRLLEALVYVLVVSVLGVSAVAYLVARQGYLRRVRAHVRTPRAEIEAGSTKVSPSTTVLIPSYREQPRVILQTMLSAGLQEVSNLRVVLLLDDPPEGLDPERHRMLQAARDTPTTVNLLLDGACDRFQLALERTRSQIATGDQPDHADLKDLIADYDHAVNWLEKLASSWTCHDHTDDFFVDQVLGALARDLSVVAAALRGAAEHRSSLDAERVIQLRRRLVAIFSAEVTSFERKRYLTLSHDPNKAMNLNSYIGLMGGNYTEQHTSAGILLLASDDDDPSSTLCIRDADYLVTLDADSVLLPEYCLRLIDQLEDPSNHDVGVIQTPYSAYPGAPTRVERLAGATTDIQYIVHQGMGFHDAAYWVGANAVLRKSAIEQLRVEDASEGRPVIRFISDRTVIEDTESTLDLTAKGWRIVNYPERLAYSASPPDFGSLCIQRRRWANGGLVILDKLRAHWRAKKDREEKRRPVELLLRLNYLASIAWATVGLALLLVYPFDSSLMSYLVVAMCVPYFAIMAADLKRCGHRRSDVVRIYGFNLVMLPVNAAGVLRSIGQMITGHKVAFDRTPKVKRRVPAPATFVISAYLIAALSAYLLAQDIENERWAHAAFAGTNLVLIIPAIIGIIGLRNSITDVWIGFVNLLFKPAKHAPDSPALDPLVDWAAVLYHGSLDKPRAPHRRATPATQTATDPETP